MQNNINQQSKTDLVRIFEGFSSDFDFFFRRRIAGYVTKKKNRKRRKDDKNSPSNFFIVAKYRGELMGIAVLLVLIYHYFTCTMGFMLLPVIPPLGYCGVEIFLFLSGFGLCLGYGKYKSVSAFYKRRAARIYPTYLIVLTISALTVSSLSVMEILLQSTTLPAFIHIDGLKAFDWYVPAIALYYLLFPLYYYLIGKGPKWAIALLICSFIPSVLYITEYLTYFHPYIVGRIPIFVVGVIAGVLYVRKAEIGRHTMIALEVIAVIGFIAMFITINRTSSIFYKYFIVWLPFVIITPGLCLFLCRILEHMPKSVCLSLSFVGGISLEVYLIHAVYMVRYGNYVMESEWLSSAPLKWLAGLTFVISGILSGYLVSRFVKFATKWLCLAMKSFKLFHESKLL